MKQTNWFYILLLLLSKVPLQAQEMVVPLQFNIQLKHPSEQQKIKKHRATLPFVDDFSYTGPYPDPNLWEDKQAYINNTMSANPVNRGVATLDGLNQWGRPYVASPTAISKADSLTSTTINLNGYTAANNIYLSFFAQPEGLGFAPEEKDSLLLYFKNSANEWNRVWELKGTSTTVFKMYILPVTDPQYLHSNFQFRFINIASPNINDDMWNLDFVKLDENRALNDSITNEIGFTVEPTSILYPYLEMPYRHFLVNPSAWTNPAQTLSISNRYSTVQNLPITHTATELLSSTSLHNSTNPLLPVPAKGSTTTNFLSYTINYTPPTPQSKVVVEDKYFYPAVNATDRRINDTITRITQFDNYFAYDDGSVERSYFLLPAFNQPSKVALRFQLSEADTLRGLGIHFGAQVPSAAGKYFSLVLYKNLGGSGLNDSIILQQDLYQVLYDTTYNGYTNYAFANPVRLDSGTYYIGVTQPANFGSDSIYYGLDMNNTSNLQQLFYNVSGTWESSNVAASIMLRPIVGPYFTPSAVEDTPTPVTSSLILYPNPAYHTLTLEKKYQWIRIYSIAGACLRSIVPTLHTVDISDLPAQTYYIETLDEYGQRRTSKFIKQ